MLFLQEKILICEYLPYRNILYNWTNFNVYCGKIIREMMFTEGTYEREIERVRHFFMYVEYTHYTLATECLGTLIVLIFF